MKGKTSFMKRIHKTETCWLWTGARRKPMGPGEWGGYGRFSPKRGVQYYAHRYAWELAYGSIPVGMMVCHTCDNPICVRPDHLFLGTHNDNMADARNKGRVKNQNVYVIACPKGHSYNEENTYHHNNKRHCKECNRIAARAYQRRKANA